MTEQLFKRCDHCDNPACEIMQSCAKDQPGEHRVKLARYLRAVPSMRAGLSPKRENGKT